MNQKKPDVVSAILDNTDLLDAFTDTLIVEEPKEDLLSSVSTSLGIMQKIRCYLWRKAKDIMSILSIKIQVLAVLAEFNFKNEEKKIHLTLTKKD